VDWAEALGQAERKHGVRLEAQKGGVGVIVDGAAGPGGEIGGIPDVIPVAVGKEKGVWLEFFFLQEVEKTLGGIDGESVAAEIDEVGVGGSEAARKDQGFRHGSSFLRPFVTVYDYV